MRNRMIKQIKMKKLRPLLIIKWITTLFFTRQLLMPIRVQNHLTKCNRRISRKWKMISKVNIWRRKFNKVQGWKLLIRMVTIVPNRILIPCQMLFRTLIWIVLCNMLMSLLKKLIILLKVWHQRKNNLEKLLEMLLLNKKQSKNLSTNKFQIRLSLTKAKAPSKPLLNLSQLPKRNKNKRRKNKFRVTNRWLNKFGKRSILEKSKQFKMKLNQRKIKSRKMCSNNKRTALQVQQVL